MKIDAPDDFEFLVAIKISRSPTGPDGPSDLGRSGLIPTDVRSCLEDYECIISFLKPKTPNAKLQCQSSLLKLLQEQRHI